MNLSFENHGAFWLFWLLPVVMVLFVVFENIRRRRLTLFLDPSLLRHRMPSYARFSAWLRFFFFALALVCLILALLKPYDGFEMREITSKGVDLYFLVDLSPSMMAQDIKPNRLTRARFEMKDFLKLFRGDRVGLIGFSGESYVFVPLTADYGAFDLFLDELDTSLIPSHGTDIAGAITLATQALKKREVDSAKAIVLITDGEDSIGLDRAILEEIQKSDIRVYVLGMGSPDGAPIPHEEGDYITDENGKIVISKLDEANLTALALSTGGGYVRSRGNDADITEIYFNGIKKEFAEEEGKTLKRKLLNHVFQPFLLLALIYLAMELLITNRRFYWIGKLLRRKKP